MSDPFEEVDREYREALQRERSRRAHPSQQRIERVRDGSMEKYEEHEFALIAQAVGYCTFCERAGNICDHVFCPIHRQWGKDSGSGTQCCWNA